MLLLCIDLLVKALLNLNPGPLLPYIAHKFKQIISDPTHISPQSSSCIDLVFTDQPNYVTGCGTHPSLHPNCHHQITFCKLNLKLEYPSPYERLVWNFKKSNNDAIKKAIELVNWNFLFSNKSVDENVTDFSQTLIFF